MDYYIYGLYSTEDNFIRYVGKTKNKLKARKAEHICDALTKNFKNHKCNWIRKVYADGFKIDIILLETSDEKNWVEREVYWINRLKESNNLVNELPGGDCGGIGGKLQSYLSYDEAKKFVKENMMAKSIEKYGIEYNKNPEKYKGIIPKAPEHVYKLRGEWVSWGDYLSTGAISSIEKHKNFIPYEELRKIVQDEKIKNHRDYFKFINGKGSAYPAHPEKTYKDVWVDWSTFLTNEKKQPKFTYEEFCEYVLSLPFVIHNFKTQYQDMITNGLLNKRAPYHPDRLYNKGFLEIKKDLERLRKEKQ